MLGLYIRQIRIMQLLIHCHLTIIKINKYNKNKNKEVNWQNRKIN